MKKTKKFKPYNKANKCNLAVTGKGVYFIYERNWIGTFEIVYIGYSGSDVKKTMYRHFQKWVDKRHPENKRVQRIERVTYFKNFENNDFLCKVIFCKSADEAVHLESAFIAKLKPRDNTYKIEFDKEQKFYLDKAEKATEIKEDDYLADLPF